MSQVKVTGNASGTGTLTIAAPNTNSDYTLTLPAATGNILTSATTTGFPAGSVLQVVQGTIASGTTTTSTSFVDTGLTVSITPSSSSSKIMVIACCTNVLNDGSNKIEFQLLRGASVLQLSVWGANVRTDGAVPFSYLDSPATTSSTTYKVQFRTQNAATTAYISNSNNISSIVAMEIAA